MRMDVTFNSGQATVAGWLYLPDNLEAGTQVPGIVLANALGSVRTIVLPTYAERFAAAGFAALVFDYSTFGESGGEPRQHINPAQQLDDIRNAITWLRAQPQINPDAIGGWGLSIGGVHMLHLGAFDRRLKAVVSVATGLNVNELFFGREGLQQMLAQLNQDRDRRLQTGDAATYIPTVGRPNTPALMPNDEAYDFYTQAHDNYAPTWENRITIESVELLIGYFGEAAIEFIAPTPLLMLHGAADLIPPAALQPYFDRAGDPKKLVFIGQAHTDVYDKPDAVEQAAAESIEWFRTHLC